MTTVALIAAKDAGDSIAETVQAVGRLRGVDEVWVVDDGSSDDTAARAHGAGATVIRLDANLGKGGALGAGVAATPHATRYLLADADLRTTAAGLQPLLDRSGDLLVGRLPAAAGRGGFGVVKRFARAGIRRASGFESTEPLSGQRVVDAEVLRGLVLAPRFGVEVGMTIDVVRSGGAVVEIPVHVDHDHTGRTLRGFTHRARQGRDIAGALLSRLTTTRQRLVAVVLTAVLAFGALSAMSVSSAPPGGRALPHASRVVLFSFDRLALADLDRTDLPALHSLRRAALAGALSVRTTDRRSLQRRSGPERPSVFDAYASLGASARVRAVSALATAPVGANGVTPAAMAAARDLARRDHAADLPGALGDALHTAGKRTALVATAELVDGDRSSAGIPALAAVADHLGRVDHADVSPGLLESVARAPFGLRASTPAFLVATASALRAADVVLVDPGETTRAADAGSVEASRVEALRHTDEILGALLAARPVGTAVIVFAPTPTGTAWELTPIIISDTARDRGSIASPSTRRASLGVLSDIAPTTLALLGVEPGPRMTGAALRSSGRAPDLGALRRLDVDGAVRARFFQPAAVTYTFVMIAFYLLLITAVLRTVTDGWRRTLRLGTCVAAAFPLAILVTGAAQHWLHAGGESPLVLLFVCGGLGVAVATLPRVGPAYVLAALTAAVIAIDVAVTGPIHAASILGYSIQTSGRFYGLPNASTSVFAASLFLVAAGVVGRRPTVVRRSVGVAVLAVGVAFVAAPWLGNDVGGTLTLLPIGGATAWIFLGHRITGRAAVVGAALAAVTVLAYVGASAVFGGGHLGHAATEGAKDNATITNTLAHRFDSNFGQLFSQPWGFLCIALALYGIYAIVTRQRSVAFIPADPPLRAAAVAILVTSIVGFVVNDSGPGVIVLCEVVLAPALALLALTSSTSPISVPERR